MIAKVLAAYDSSILLVTNSVHGVGTGSSGHTDGIPTYVCAHPCNAALVTTPQSHALRPHMSGV